MCLGWREWVDGGQRIWMSLILSQILSIHILLINNLEPKERLRPWVHVSLHGINYKQKKKK